VAGPLSVSCASSTLASSSMSVPGVPPWEPAPAIPLWLDRIPCQVLRDRPRHLRPAQPRHLLQVVSHESATGSFQFPVALLPQRPRPQLIRCLYSRGRSTFGVQFKKAQPPPEKVPFSEPFEEP
jgi:hypothetical protein